MMNEWDAGRRKVFLLMFRFQKAGSSKFSAAGFWLRTDRRLMPWRFWLRKAVALAGAFWGLQGYIGRQSVRPQILGAEQKTKNFQLFSRVTSEGKPFSVQLFLAEFTFF